MPQAVFALDEEGLVVNLYEAAEAELTLRRGTNVAVRLASGYPFDGSARLELRPERGERFALRLRPPGWCTDWRVTVNGEDRSTATDARGYVLVDREWAAGDTVEIEMEMTPRVVVDTIGNRGHAALMRGPLVYAADTSYLPAGQLIDDVALRLPATGIEATRADGSVHLRVPAAWLRGDGAHVWGEGQRYRHLAADGVREEGTVELVPFFEAGNRDPDCYRDGVWPNEETSRRITYQVWLPYVVV
jgi:hypothetical protein